MQEVAEKVRVGVAGATGYVGLEIIRLLLKHPGYQLVMAGSVSYAGQALADYAPALRGYTDLILTDAQPEEFAQNCDLVITALPHGVSGDWVKRMHNQDLVILDHSGDFRFHDVKRYEKAYGLTHPCPELLPLAVYGRPEQFREELKTAQIISNPGCYPTCSLTALAPLFQDHWAEGQVIIDAYSGTSGAGRKSDPVYGLSEMGENLKPYGVVGHRHQAEIADQLSNIAGCNVQVSFTPHLAPIRRGMLASIYVKPAHDRARDPQTVRAFLNDFYKAEPFVQVLPLGKLPETRPLIGTNCVQIALAYDKENDYLKLFSALDNLGKGAAAQAIQALNCRFGWPETLGLEALPQVL